MTGATAEHIKYQTISTCPSSTRTRPGGGGLWFKKNQDGESGRASGESISSRTRKYIIIIHT